MRRVMLFTLILFSTMTAFVDAQSENSDREQLVLSNNQFAFDFYSTIQQRESGNFVYSPYVLSQQFAILYAGASGDTEQQIASTFHFDLSPETLHPTFRLLTDHLLSVTDEYLADVEFNAELLGKDDEMPAPFNIANGLWGDTAVTWEQSYFDLLDRYYMVESQVVDFQSDPEGARQDINGWISEKTYGVYHNVISPEMVQGANLIMVSTAFFNEPWAKDFQTNNTQDAPFYLLDDTTVSVPMMHEGGFYYYTEGETYQAISLFYYYGKSAMLIILPSEGEFEAFEDTFNAQMYADILGGLESQDLTLMMPRFEFEADVPASGILREMGMTDVFDADGADLSYMSSPDSPEKPFINDLLHKTKIKVDEEGTIVATVQVSYPVVNLPALGIEMNINRPFIFMIYDLETGSILFMGRVLNPVG